MQFLLFSPEIIFISCRHKGYDQFSYVNAMDLWRVSTGIKKLAFPDFITLE